MANIPLHRKVMFLNDEPSIGNLQSLLRKIGRENILEAAGNSLLDSLAHNQFDAVILDLRPSRLKAKREARGIREVRAGWMGKLLVIVAEVNGPRTLDLLERYLFKGLPEGLLWLVSRPIPSPQH